MTRCRSKVAAHKVAVYCSGARTVLCAWSKVAALNPRPYCSGRRTVLCAWSPVRQATARPWARGEPPPHGSESSRRRAMEMDLLGGSSTSAWSP
jgi:hypothetical protein